MCLCTPSHAGGRREALSAWSAPTCSINSNPIATSHTEALWASVGRLAVIALCQQEQWRLTKASFSFRTQWLDGNSNVIILSPPDPLLLGLLQLSVPLQHVHDGPLLLLRQVAQVDHGSSSQFAQQAGVEALCGGQTQPTDPVAVGQVQTKGQCLDPRSKAKQFSKKPSAWLIHKVISLSSVSQTSKSSTVEKLYC